METKTKHTGYTPMPNHIIFDKKLSLKARGLLPIILSRPSGWKLFINELLQHAEKEGRAAMQAALKELVNAGYLRLVRVRDVNTNRLSGTHYEVIRDACQLLRQTDSPTTGKAGRQENATLNNTDTRINTDNLKNTNQQQNEKIAAVDGYKIEVFFEDLMLDKVWRSNFLTTPFGEALLSDDNLDHLLFQFRYQSLSGDKTYMNTNKAKEHFRNWFNRHKEKESLLTSINAEKKQQKKLVEAGAKIVANADPYLQMRLQQTFPNTASVVKAREQLGCLTNKLRQLEIKLLDLEKRRSFAECTNAMVTLIDDIDRGEKVNQLDWFCKNIPQSNLK